MNIPAITTGYQIGFNWTLPSSNGGTAVIDFRILQSTDNSTFTNIDSNVVPLQYIALTLTPGTYYFY